MKQKFMNSMKVSTGKLQFHPWLHWTSDCFESSFEKGTVCVLLSYLNNEFLLLSFQVLFIRKRMPFPSMLFLLRLFPLFTRFIILRCILVCLCVPNDFANLSKASHFSPGLSKTRWDPALRYSKWISEWNPITIMKAEWKPTETIPFNENKCAYCSWLEF